MTPKKQVSPVIRISRGERDVSARATHLEAATRKFLVTTNERKQMSTKTNFKRIALVAVAALGMGVLSSVPSQAAVSNLTVTATNGTAILGSNSDTGTAAVISVAGLATVGTGDTITITFINKGAQPATVVPRMAFLDTATGNASPTTRILDTISSLPGSNENAAGRASFVTTTMAVNDSITASNAGFGIDHPAAAGYMGARFVVQLESTTASRSTSGTYTYTAIATSYVGGAVVTTATADFTITIAALAAESTVVDPSKSTAFINSTVVSTASDGVVNALATASSTAAANIQVKTFNASSIALPESITVTISGAGILSYGSVNGASLTIKADTDAVTDISVLPDGRAGVATINVSTPTRVFAPKTMSFYSAAPKTLVASVPTPNFAVGSNADSIRVTATDASGTIWAGAVYVYASTAADALIAGSNTTPTLCTWDPADNRHECTVTGTAAGTAKFKAIDASTVAAATVTSNEVSAVVNTNTAATVKLSFDKATYAPGERAYIYVTPLDSAGKEIAKVTLSNLLAAGGISTTAALTFAGSTTTSDSLTATTSYSADANSSSTSGAKAGSFRYTVFMPAAGGVVTISATGGTSLPVAGRVAVSATATVTDTGAQALAAVNALATTVASLKTLITTLTNLVLKIQKKVKA